MIHTPTRFLILTPAIDGADGISELSRQVCSTLARAVAPSCVEVWALAGGKPQIAPLAGVEAWSAEGSRARFIRRAMARAARRACDLHVVALHAHLSPLASMLGRRGANVTLFLIGIEVWTPLRGRERRAVERADRLVAISAFTARRFRDANPLLAARPITVCAPGIGVAPPAASIDVREGFALIVGRLSSEERYKGHDALIDVWPAVRSAVPRARLIVAGDGDDRARLEAAAAARGLSDAVVFLGRVDDRTLAALYARADFFVMPSTHEGFGLVYLEAMRAGKPCIAVHGSADEIIRDGVDGLVIETGSTGTLARAIIRLFSQAGERERMGRAARARVQHSFSEAAFGVRLLQALECAPVLEDDRRRASSVAAAVPATR